MFQAECCMRSEGHLSIGLLVSLDVPALRWDGRV